MFSHSIILLIDWNKDWLPDSYPNTDVEREKAAKKYNLHPKEYKPYADDGFGHGDYPKLPFHGAVTRDPFYPYDNPEYKRNFNEVVRNFNFQIYICYQLGSCVWCRICHGVLRGP